MYAPDDSHDPHAHVGDGIAEDRRTRILRQFAYSAAALSAAGLIVLLNGCEREVEEPATPSVSEPAPTAAAPDGSGIDLASLAPLPAPLDGFALFPTDDKITFVPSAEGVKLDGRGYFASMEEYGPDFTVSYEYRFPEADPLGTEEIPGENTGCLLFIDEADKVWPRCLEVQGKWGETASIKSNARDIAVESELNEAARDEARKPPGEWNAVEIVSRDGALSVSLNGEPVSTSEPTELTRGRIGFQAEGYPVEFRAVRIAE